MEDTIIRVLVVDDHPMIRRGLAAMIQSEKSLQWIGEASNGTEAIDQCAASTPDVVLMDLMMPGQDVAQAMDGVAATQVIMARLPNTRVLILTSYHEPNVVQRAMQAGAAGYLVKTASAEELVHAIHKRLCRQARAGI